MDRSAERRTDSGGAATESIAQVAHCPNLEKCQRWYACDEVGPFCRSCWRSHNGIVTHFEAGERYE